MHSFDKHDRDILVVSAVLGKKHKQKTTVYAVWMLWLFCNGIKLDAKLKSGQVAV